MQRPNRRVIAGGAAVLAVVALGFAVSALVPGDEELRQAAETQIERRLGVRATIGSLSWRLLPAPEVRLRDIKLAQSQPLTIRQLAIHPAVGRTLRRRTIMIERVEVDGAVVPTVSLRAFRNRTPAPARQAPVTRISSVTFRDVTWISRTGIPVPLEGDIEFDEEWRPHSAEVRRADFAPAATITLARQGVADRWTTRVALGTGTANGTLALVTESDGTLVLGGTLIPRDVEVASATAALNRRSPIRGKANGRTAVSARGMTPGDLGRSLRLQTEFTIAPATVLRFDVDKAIRTLGIDNDGQTKLESVTGTMDMQNTGEGAVIHFVDVRVRAASFEATGEATVFNRRIAGRGTLVKGLLAVPMTVSGTTREPKISVLEGIAGGMEGPRPEPPGTPKTRTTVPGKDP